MHIVHKLIASPLSRRRSWFVLAVVVKVELDKSGFEIVRVCRGNVDPERVHSLVIEIIIMIPIQIMQ